MKLGVCPQPLYRRSFHDALATIRELGFAGMELPLDARSPFVDLPQLLRGGADDLRAAIDAAGLELTAVSIHQEGQLLLGPHHEDTDRIFAGTPEQKIAYATERLCQAADAAHLLGVDVVVGFVGCEDWSRFFPWPAPDGWERMLPEFRERMLPILDHYARRGVRFAQEPHPKQIVYDLETAQQSIELLGGHDAWGFNLDPANLAITGGDPVLFAAELGARILHVHAKDAEVVPHRAARSGVMAHGAWNRRERGFRFRIPGWGDVPWRRLLTELTLAGYDGWITLEHEDPTFGAIDGLQKGIDTLRPLLPHGPREEPWW